MKTSDIQSFIIFPIIVLWAGQAAVADAESTDPCASSVELPSDHRRVDHEDHGPGRCDSDITEGWYRFTVGGEPAVIPTVCIKPFSCGSDISLRVDLEGTVLPNVGEEIGAWSCGAYNILGSYDCCVLRQPIRIRNCSSFLAYYVQAPDRCSVGFCVQEATHKVPVRVLRKTGEDVATDLAEQRLLAEATSTTSPSTSTTQSLPRFPCMEGMIWCSAGKPQCRTDEECTVLEEALTTSTPEMSTFEDSTSAAASTLSVEEVETTEVLEEALTTSTPEMSTFEDSTSAAASTLSVEEVETTEGVTHTSINSTSDSFVDGVIEDFNSTDGKLWPDIETTPEPTSTQTTVTRLLFKITTTQEDKHNYETSSPLFNDTQDTSTNGTTETVPPNTTDTSPANVSDSSISVSTPETDSVDGSNSTDAPTNVTEPSTIHNATHDTSFVTTDFPYSSTTLQKESESTTASTTMSATASKTKSDSSTPVAVVPEQTSSSSLSTSVTGTTEDDSVEVTTERPSSSSTTPSVTVALHSATTTTFPVVTFEETTIAPILPDVITVTTTTTSSTEMTSSTPTTSDVDGRVVLEFAASDDIKDYDHRVKSNLPLLLNKHTRWEKLLHPFTEDDVHVLRVEKSPYRVGVIVNVTYTSSEGQVTIEADHLVDMLKTTNEDDNKEFEKLMGTDMVDYYKCVEQACTVNLPTSEPSTSLFYNKLPLFIAIIVLITICLFILIFGLVYFRFFRNRESWNRQRDVERAKLKEKRDYRGTENPVSDAEMMKDEQTVTGTPLTVNGAHPPTAASIDDERGWIVPIDQAPETPYQLALKTEDTKL